MTTDKNSSRPGTSQYDYDALVPDELLAASHRRAVNRARTSRTLDRSKMRRRVLPTVVVTSVVMVGTGLANSFVGSTLPAATTTTTSTVPAYVRSQAARNAQTLANLSATLANDRRIVAALTTTAQSASATAASVAASTLAAINTAAANAVAASRRASSTTTVGSSASTSTGPSSGVGPTTTVTRTATASTATPAAPVTTTTAAPAPVTTTTAAPVAAAPPTHTTSGASGAG